MHLPQLDRLFLTDAGLETDLIFNRGMELPCFSSINLVKSADGRRILDEYFRSFLDLAERTGAGCLLETATWRASADWAEPLGVSLDQLDRLNAEAVAMLMPLKREYAARGVDLVVSGCIGPRGDGYDPGRIMSVGEAEAYHGRQAAVLAAAGADMLGALTMTNVHEATGIVRAARRLGIPVAISFTVETDGRLPTGDGREEAITTVDAATGGYAAYFGVNCAHPAHFAQVLLAGGEGTRRVRALRANASRCSHAELDVMTELDDGDPAELGAMYRDLRAALPQLNVLGGCCGTDIRHVTAIAENCAGGQRLGAAA